MLENHSRYPFVFNASDFYSNGKQSKSVEKKLFWNWSKSNWLLRQDNWAVLQYSLGLFPWALATAEGSPRETKKAAFRGCISKGNYVQWLLFRNIKLGNQTTFAEPVNTLFPKLKSEASACGRTDAVLDVYVDESIKDAEWNNRDTTEAMQFKNLIRGHKNQAVEKISQGIKW